MDLYALLLACPPNEQSEPANGTSADTPPDGAAAANGTTAVAVPASPTKPGPPTVRPHSGSLATPTRAAGPPAATLVGTATDTRSASGSFSIQSAGSTDLGLEVRPAGFKGQPCCERWGPTAGAALPRSGPLQTIVFLFVPPGTRASQAACGGHNCTQRCGVQRDQF